MGGHTNGKVRTDESEHYETYQDIRILGSDGHKICTVCIDDAPVLDYNTLQYANARRLVACWNACDGISTEVLESEKSAPVGWSRTASKLIAATTQRDEAVDLLNRCHEGFSAFIMGRRMSRRERDALVQKISVFLGVNRLKGATS